MRTSYFAEHFIHKQRCTCNENKFACAFICHFCNTHKTESSAALGSNIHQFFPLTSNVLIHFWFAGVNACNALERHRTSNISFTKLSSIEIIAVSRNVGHVTIPITYIVSFWFIRVNLVHRPQQNGNKCDLIMVWFNCTFVPHVKTFYDLMPDKWFTTQTKRTHCTRKIMCVTLLLSCKNHKPNHRGATTMRITNTNIRSRRNILLAQFHFCPVYDLMRDSNIQLCIRRPLANIHFYLF